MNRTKIGWSAVGVAVSMMIGSACVSGDESRDSAGDEQLLPLVAVDGDGGPALAGVVDTPSGEAWLTSTTLTAVEALAAQEGVTEPVLLLAGGGWTAPLDSGSGVALLPVVLTAGSELRGCVMDSSAQQRWTFGEMRVETADALARTQEDFAPSSLGFEPEHNSPD